MDSEHRDEGQCFCQNCGTQVAGKGEWDHPAFATPEEFDLRTAQLLMVEAQEPEEWWYLSFAEKKGFLGGLYIRARGIMDATLRARMLGLNPGGEVMSWGPISQEGMDAMVPEEKRGRLLSKEEVNE